MEQLHFRFTTRLELDSEVKNHYFTLKCIPKSNVRQRIESCNITITPDADIFYNTDSFGNITVSGSIIPPHSSFEFTVEGSAAAGLDVFEELEDDEIKCAYYKYHTGYTRPGKYLEEYFKSLDLTQCKSTYDKVTAIMHAINRDLVYEKKITDISTSAEQAMSIGKGVCQDYAHIMLALCRMSGIAVRYTVGIMKGEGESHAWVEALCKNRWYGFDPTNNLLVDGNYIKISSGRDYSDCIINKGQFIGNASQHTIVAASVTD